MSWLPEAIGHLERHQPFVLVTVAEHLGSAPREAGVKMLVSEGETAGNIGGGVLEYQAIEKARAMLQRADGDAPELELVSLGPALGQCCGGSVQLLYERVGPDGGDWLRRWSALVAQGGSMLVLTPLEAPGGEKRFLEADASFDLPRTGLVETADQGRCFVEPLADASVPLWLFGAGHVGRAVGRALEPLPFHITWVESRPDFLPEAPPARVQPLLSAEPQLELPSAPAGALVLIMTHSHAQDFKIIEAALRRGDLGYVGLIGSRTKRARFLRRLHARDLGEAVTARLTCPIGAPGIRGKAPAVIAAAVAVQLLEVTEALAERRQAPAPSRHAKRASGA